MLVKFRVFLGEHCERSRVVEGIYQCDMGEVRPDSKIVSRVSA
jgi:hypothetical protein